MLEEIGPQDEATGARIADQLCLSIDGKSPYNGSLPFMVELEVFCAVVDDEFVVTVRNGPDVAARVSNVTTFAKEQAMCQAVQAVLGINMPDELPGLTGELANYGYRYIKKESGAVRGHTETVSKRLPSTVLSYRDRYEMMLVTPLGSGVQPASLPAQFQGRKSSTRFTG